MKTICVLLFVCALSAAAASFRGAAEDNQLGIMDFFTGMKTFTAMVPSYRKLGGVLKDWKKVDFATGKGVAEAFQATINNFNEYYATADENGLDDYSEYLEVLGEDLEEELAVNGSKFKVDKKKQWTYAIWDGSLIDITLEMTNIQEALANGDGYAIANECMRIYDYYVEGDMNDAVDDIEEAPETLLAAKPGTKPKPTKPKNPRPKPSANSKKPKPAKPSTGGSGKKPNPNAKPNKPNKPNKPKKPSGSNGRPQKGGIGMAALRMLMNGDNLGGIANAFASVVGLFQ